MQARRLFADVSSNNGRVDIGEYSREGHALLVVKATEGTRYVNPLHLDECKQAHHFGITVAHYHFCRPGQRDIAAELRNFRAAYLRGWRKGDYVVLDLEVDELGGPEATRVYARSFIAEIERHTGHPVVLYTYASFYREHLLGLQWKGRRLWMADYDEPVATEGRWAKQFTDGKTGPEPHAAAGIGTCDMSILNAPLAGRLAVRKKRTGRQ